MTRAEVWSVVDTTFIPSIVETIVTINQHEQVDVEDDGDESQSQEDGEDCPQHV